MALLVFMSLPLLSVKHQPEHAFVAACSKCSPMASLFIKPVSTVSPESCFFPPILSFTAFAFVCISCLQRGLEGLRVGEGPGGSSPGPDRGGCVAV